MRNALILIVALLLISACKKQISCNGFDANKLEQFSYPEPCTLHFVSGNAEEFFVYINEIVLSDSYTYKCRDLNNICPCISYVEAIATNSNSSSPYSFLRMEMSSSSNAQIFKYNVLGYRFEFDFLNDLPNIHLMESFEYFSTYLVNDVLYADVVVLVNNDAESDIVSQVIFNREHGILRFTQKVSGTVWSLKVN